MQVTWYEPDWYWQLYGTFGLDVDLANDWPMAWHDPAHTNYLPQSAIVSGNVTFVRHANVCVSSELVSNWSRTLASLRSLWFPDLPPSDSEYWLLLDFFTKSNKGWQTMVDHYPIFGTISAYGLVYSWSEKSLVAVELNSGHVLWTHTFNRTLQLYPAVAYQCIFVGVEDSLQCLDALSGRTLWRIEVSLTGCGEVIPINQCILYVHTHGVYCCSLSGHILWQISTQNTTVVIAAAIYDNYLYLATATATRQPASTNARIFEIGLQVLDIRSGTICQQTDHLFSEPWLRLRALNPPYRQMSAHPRFLVLSSSRGFAVIDRCNLSLLIYLRTHYGGAEEVTFPHEQRTPYVVTYSDECAPHAWLLPDTMYVNRFLVRIKQASSTTTLTFVERETRPWFDALPTVCGEDEFLYTCFSAYLIQACTGVRTYDVWKLDKTGNGWQFRLVEPGYIGPNSSHPLPINTYPDVNDMADINCYRIHHYFIILRYNHINPTGFNIIIYRLELCL